jgi:hypothetical protein
VCEAGRALSGKRRPEDSYHFPARCAKSSEKLGEGPARQNLITSKFLPKIALNRPGANSALPEVLGITEDIYAELMLCGFPGKSR